MDETPKKLDYATPMQGSGNSGWWRFVLQMALVLCGLIGLVFGFLMYGVAMGDVGEEPNHLAVAMGQAIMVCSALALLVAWRLSR